MRSSIIAVLPFILLGYKKIIVGRLQNQLPDMGMKKKR
jgi:hypothetical protein